MAVLPTEDRPYLEAGLEELQDYLLSDQLYWPLGRRAELPRLTIGGLLLALRRAETLGSAGDHRSRLEEARLRWGVAWERKVLREFAARLKLWAAYLEDYRAAPAAHAPDYPGQVRERVLLDLLRAETFAPPKESAALAGLDEFLRAALVPGGFVWRESLRPAFPPDPFWYLYGRLRE